MPFLDDVTGGAFDGAVTEPLTVWRKLHVEIDSMGGSPAGFMFDFEDEPIDDVPDPDISAFAAAFAPAFIKVVPHPEATQSNLEWSYHFDFLEAQAKQYASAHSDLFHSAPDYWSVYVLAAYEGFKPGGGFPGNTEGDNDAEIEVALGAGITLDYTPNVGTDLGSIVYYEVVRDLVFEQWDSEGWGQAQFDRIWMALALHEVGHQFLGEGHSAAMTDIMWGPTSDADEENAILIPLFFSPEQIARLRGGNNGPPLYNP